MTGQRCVSVWGAEDTGQVHTCRTNSLSAALCFKMALITSFSCFSEMQAGGGAGMLRGVPGGGRGDHENLFLCSGLMGDITHLSFEDTRD